MARSAQSWNVAGPDERSDGHPLTIPERHPMEIWISYVLRGGVVIAAAIIAAGLLVFVLHGSAPSTAAALRALHTGPDARLSLGYLAASMRGGHGRGIIYLGLLALILTPVARVAMTAVLFIVQRDRIFTAVTCVVLLILIAGLVGFGA